MEIESKHQYAGFWKRTMAAIIDGIVLTLARGIVGGLVILMIHGIMNLFNIPNESRMLVWLIAASAGALINFWGTWLYYCLMESSSSQATLGKMALGIKVVDYDGERVTFERLTARHFTKFISWIIIFVGFFMAGFSSRKQALHDIISSCLVVDKYWS